jgi:hypothetical protein
MPTNNEIAATIFQLSNRIDVFAAALAHVTAKLNRVEAEVAHQRAVVAIDPAKTTLDDAITLLSGGADEIAERRAMLLADNARWMTCKRNRRDK